MRTLARAAAETAGEVHSLAVGLHAFDRLGVGLRRGEVSMVAGQPGSGKSSLALHLAVAAAVPTLYICADTSSWTMAIRTGAMATGRTQAEVEGYAAQQGGQEWLAGLLRQAAGHVSWVFDSAPTLDDIADEVDAYEEVWGPGHLNLIVIDNLIDVADGDDEWAAMRRVMKEVKFLARDTDSAVLLLHHTSEAHNYDICPPRSAIQGKVSQLPSLILTVDNDSDRQLMGIAAVKNRYGKASPSGTYAEYVSFDAARMRIQDIGRN